MKLQSDEDETDYKKILEVENSNRNDFKSMEFHKKVVEGYEVLASSYNGKQNFININANRNADGIANDIIKDIITFINEKNIMAVE